ncbi:MAG: DUF3465 domain-containing protein [Phycisphaerae bacterium]
MLRVKRRRSWQHTLLLLVFAVVVWALREYAGVGQTSSDTHRQAESAQRENDGAENSDDAAPPASESTRTREPRTADPRNTQPLDVGTARVADAFARRESDFFVTLDAVVIRLLDDDNFGDRHQNFIVQLANDQTLKISHNIDLAPRVPLRTHDRIRLRGEYEWSEQGGVLHWTHHDPGGRKTGGWIEHRGKKYQ